MNRIAVIYCSVHHKNTEKLISYVDTTDNFDLCKSEDIKLGDYDLIGFASGIYMGKLHGKLIRFIKTNQSKLKNIFLVYKEENGARNACKYVYHDDDEPNSETNSGVCCG